MKIKAASRKINPFQSPHGLLVFSFLALILLGTALLWLPWSHAPGRVGFLDALFTATSAVCVTGLIVVDTPVDYTPLGQTIILLLFQAGGLGVMTFAALAFNVVGRRLSLATQAAVQDSIFQRDLATEFKSAFGAILRMTFLIEALGAALLFVSFAPIMDAGQALFSAIFHSVSAFCNAGFSVNSDSLTGVRGRPLAMVAVMGLIVLGGLGHTVLYELRQYVAGRCGKGRQKKIEWFSLHAKTALVSSAVLIAGGFVLLLAFGLTANEKTWTEKLSGALFQSVTARTAGFNSVDIGSLPLASLYLVVLLMFIGGSPGSCAGGVKTTSAAVWLAQLRAGLRGEREVRLFNRSIPEELAARVSLLMALAAVWNIVGIAILLATEPGASGATMSQVVFEQISAFGTVGLSTGLTSKLTVVGRCWIILTMFVGRLGPMTLALAIVHKNHANVHYPKGAVMIG